MLSQKNYNQKRQNNNQADAVASSSSLLSRTMPESLEAEAAVLGSMMLDSQCIGDVVPLISSNSFYRSEHQFVFDALIGLYERGVGLDLVLLRDELKKLGRLDEIGGPTYLAQLANAVPSSANVMYYTKIVKDKAILRELIGASSEILDEAYDSSGDIGEKLDDAERRIFDVTQQKITGEASDLKSIIHEAIEHAENPVQGMPTGYFELDDMLCGLHKGEMIIIAGRPSMGKTSFALNVAEHIAADEGKATAVFSLEMGKRQLVERILCSRAHIDLQAIRKGNLEDGAYEELVRTGSELSEKPLFIDDTSSLTPLELKAKARRLKSRYDIQCIIVDYLQLMSLGGRVDSRQQEITTISRHLKAIARELEIPVVVLSQLNRAAENREGHRPRMSDLRESGSIEQDADVVMLLHREDYYHRGEQDYEDSGKAELIIAKQRNGPTGTVNLTFLEKFTRFENLTHQYNDEF